MTRIQWSGTRLVQKLKDKFASLIRYKYPFHYQLERMDCGPACLKMIATFYGKNYSLDYLREICDVTRVGITMQGLVHGANAIGIQTLAVKLPFTSDSGNKLSDVPLPAIAYWRQNHFVVINRITASAVYISDPAQGKLKISHAGFLSNWANDGEGQGVVLLLQPGNLFFETEPPQENSGLGAMQFLKQYFTGYKKYLIFLLAALVLVSAIQFLFPYLTKSVIDVGIYEKSMNFIYLILLVQMILYFAQTALSFLQRWIILHLSSRITMLMSSDFLFKLTRLPISFYDNRFFGEIIQRINDQRRVEGFISASTISLVLSFFSVLVFGVILFSYNHLIFIVFFTGTSLYLVWIFLFLRKRKMIDYELFNEMSSNQELLYEFVYGMQEIKLQGSEKKRSLQWTNSQERLFKINLRSAALTQVQDGGAFFINQFKDILITIIASAMVINGKMSLGMLIAVQVIIGLLNGPVQQFVSFIRTGYEAKLSLNRILEIHHKEEESMGLERDDFADDIKGDIIVEHVGFRYNLLGENVLNDINFVIPEGKVTAIVGASGSGKTTLVKLLLGFYTAREGRISVGNVNLADISGAFWRKQCGAVLQDGYIFSDSILNNVGESDDIIDAEKYKSAVRVANIESFINSLALKEHTQIGSKGNGLSEGQKQRVLIARAVYKNAKFLFFDEATNALDANNEKIIMNNLNEFYVGKTVVVVAHRLSTVKNADQIVVLDCGRVVEIGSHSELVAKQGYYYTLVKNQLELGN